MVGELQVDKLKALNVPAGPQYGQLKMAMISHLQTERLLKVPM
ncbi:Uncharacterised protein [Weissella viridescens]|uniref:Uncharacterized protein n=1 Tax=Weissella viridescens TaxID=1629 RepID=A0A380P2D5_WEIVI|nr:Uncharacterised protein [Weissella viridescens]